MYAQWLTRVVSLLEGAHHAPRGFKNRKKLMYFLEDYEIRHCMCCEVGIMVIQRALYGAPRVFIPLFRKARLRAPAHPIHGRVCPDSRWIDLVCSLLGYLAGEKPV